MKVWIARDKNGKLCVYTVRPVKASDFWYLEGAPYTGDFAVLKDNGEFDSVKWEDGEPTEVELKIVGE